MLTTQLPHPELRPSPKDEGSLVWIFGSLAQSALRRGFRCKRAVRGYEKWLRMKELRPEDRLLLIEKDWNSGVLRLVAEQARNGFTLTVRHEKFTIQVQLGAAGEGRDLDLLSVAVTRFEGDVRAALIWGMDMRTFFEPPPASKGSVPARVPSPYLSPEPTMRPWFGEGQHRVVGDC